MASFRTVEVILLANGCSNCCDHCYASATHNVEHPIGTILAEHLLDMLMPLFDEAQERFVDIYYDLFDHPDPAGLARLLHRKGLYAMWDSIATNGRGIARNPMHRALLKEMKGMGSVGLQLTFHGNEQTHDLFVHRRGAFLDLIAAAKAGEEAGLLLCFPYFLTKRNVEEWAALFDRLKAEGLLTRTEHALVVGLPGTGGRAKALEAERVETADLLKLPASVQERVPHRPESEWYREALEGDHKHFVSDRAGAISLTVQGDGQVLLGYPTACDPTCRLGVLGNDSLEDIIGRYRQAGSSDLNTSILKEFRAQGSSPSLVELARTWGNPAGQKLYRVGTHALAAWILRSRQGEGGRG
jgi:MoaA/NifB/PqqE/SkfB family radical SAM enzyme